MSTRTVTVELYHRPRARWSRRRHQGWYWAAYAANGKALALASESYANRADALAAVSLLFGYSTAVILRDGDTPEHYLRAGVGS